MKAAQSLKSFSLPEMLAAQILHFSQSSYLLGNSPCVSPFHVSVSLYFLKLPFEEFQGSEMKPVLFYGAVLIAQLQSQSGSSQYLQSIQSASVHYFPSQPCEMIPFSPPCIAPQPHSVRGEAAMLGLYLLLVTVWVIMERPRGIYTGCRPSTHVMDFKYKDVLPVVLRCYFKFSTSYRAGTYTGEAGAERKRKIL